MRRRPTPHDTSAMPPVIRPAEVIDLVCFQAGLTPHRFAEMELEGTRKNEIRRVRWMIYAAMRGSADMSYPDIARALPKKSGNTNHSTVITAVQRDLRISLYRPAPTDADLWARGVWRKLTEALIAQRRPIRTERFATWPPERAPQGASR